MRKRNLSLLKIAEIWCEIVALAFAAAVVLGVPIALAYKFGIWGFVAGVLFWVTVAAFAVTSYR